MKSLQIRNIDPRMLHALKTMAKKHHRSLQGELHAILERAARTPMGDGKSDVLNLVTIRSGGKTPLRREAIYDDQGR